MAQVAPETDCSPFIVDRYLQASDYAAWSGMIRQEPSPNRSAAYAFSSDPICQQHVDQAACGSTEIGLELIVRPQADTAPPPPMPKPENGDVPETEEETVDTDSPTEAETEGESTEESTEEAGTLPETEEVIEKPAETEEIQTGVPSEDGGVEETEPGQEEMSGETHGTVEDMTAEEGAGEM